jgi:pimeloyl-ACP methyl ester carboxylesterase
MTSPRGGTSAAGDDSAAARCTTMPIEELPSARIRYELRGRGGDPTVLIHGSWVDHHTWDLVVPALSQSLDVLTYDRRGHGESTGAPRLHPVADDAGDLAALLEARNHFPAHLVAHSYGGTVALRLAMERPELVRSLALHEPPCVGLLAADPASASEGEFMLGEVRRLQRRARDGDREGSVREAMDVFTLEPGAWDRLPPSVREGFVRHVDRWVEELDDPEALRPDPKLLADLLVPALLTYGTQSPGFLRRITELLGQELHNSTVHSIPEAGHAPHLTQPAQFVGTLHMFLVERNVPVT